MKLATIEKIKEVKPHPNADRLDLVTILGYQLVCEKGLHKAGDVVIYIQPDTVLPQEEWAETYRKYSPKRVKAVKLRGEWSEGIVVRAEQVAHIINPDVVEENFIGGEVACELGVIKYEPPAPQDLSAKRHLPFQIPVTDEERWENLDDKIPFGALCDVTLKIDGQSWSAYYNLATSEFGVLGRRFEFKDGVNNNYTKHLERYGIKDKLIEFCKINNLSLCIRGESYGPGIQGFDLNPHAKGEYGLAMFSIWLIDQRRYARFGDLLYFERVARELGIPHVPILEENVPITKELIERYSIGMKKLPNGNPFEGVVINHREGSFKVINKHYDANK